MAVILKEIEAQALTLPLKERGDLIHRLILSLEDGSVVSQVDSPEAVAKAWDDEIARRVADLEAGRTEWIPAEEVFSQLDAIAKDER